MTSQHLTRPVRRTPPASALLRGHATRPLAVDPEGHLYDEYAQALALDAPAAVDRGTPWNVAAPTDLTVYESRIHLSGLGIDTTDGWVAALGHTLSPDQSGDADVVLRFRAELMRGGDPVDVDAWRSELHAWLTATDQTDGAHAVADTVIDGAIVLDRLIEETGILPPGIRVRTTSAGRIANAVSVVRWGARSGYADRAATQQALLAARDAASTEFTDWNEYVASMLFASCLVPGEDAYASFHECLPSAATLLTDPDSPWLTLEFPTADDFGIPADPSGLGPVD